MSNRYNKGRSLLVRPKVCASKPPVEAPKPDITCTVEPDGLELGTEEQEDIVFQPLNDAFDSLAEVEITNTPTQGELDYETPMLNGDEQVGQYTAADEDYEEEITITFTWPDASICQTVLSVVVEGPENGD